MSDLIIYHNGSCSKCRGALEILQELQIPHSVRWYLADPLTADELAALLQKLDMHPSELVRKSEAIYKERFEGQYINEHEWLSVLVENPELIERPIIEKGNKAIIARPPEKALLIVNG